MDARARAPGHDGALLLMLGGHACAMGDVALADRAVALLPPPHERGLWDRVAGGLLAHQAQQPPHRRAAAGRGVDGQDPPPPRVPQAGR